MGGLLSATYIDPSLYHACVRGDKDEVIKLLNEGAAKYVNYSSGTGDTPLHNVCRHGWLDLVKVFIEMCNCKVWATDKGGLTPVHYIFKYAHMDIIEYFIDRYGIIEIVNNLLKDEKSDKSIARVRWLNAHWCMIKKYQAAELLADIRYNHCPTSDGNKILHLACMVDNHPHVLYHLLEDKTVNINVTNKDGMTPLHVACMSKRPDIVQLLCLKATCDLNFTDKNGDTPLLTACRSGQLDSVNVLLFEVKCKVDVVNNDGDTALHVACRGGSADIIAMVLMLQKDVDVKNKDGDTPLHISCRQNALNTVKVLVNEHGCDVNVKNNDLDAPLHVACGMQSHDIVQILLNANQSETRVKPCDPNNKNKQGNTALHIACEMNSFVIAQSILSHSECDPNISNNDGMLPFHVACAAGGYSNVLMLLSDSRCDANAKTSDGVTSLEIAIKGNKMSIVELLLSNTKYDVSATAADCNASSLIQMTSNIKIVKGLVKHGIKLTSDDVFQLVSKSHGTKGVIKVLQLCMSLNNLQWKPDDRTTNGDTALHLASKLNTDIVDFLISEAECDPSAINNDGDTPLHIACDVDNGDIVALQPETIDVSVLNCMSIALVANECDFLDEEGLATIPMILAMGGFFKQLFGKPESSSDSDSEASSHRFEGSIHELSDEQLDNDDYNKYSEDSISLNDDLMISESNEEQSDEMRNDKCESTNKYNDSLDEANVYLESISECTRNEFENSSEQSKNTSKNVEDEILYDTEQMNLTANQRTEMKYGDSEGDIEDTDKQSHDIVSIGSSTKDNQHSNDKCDETSTDDEHHSDTSSIGTSESDKYSSSSLTSSSTEDESIPFLLEVYTDFLDKLMNGKKTFYCKGSKDVRKSPLLQFSFHSNAIKYMVQTPATVQSLLSKFKDGLYMKNKSGETPLHVACKAARPLNVLYLLSDTECALSAVNSDGDMPLHVACKANRALTVYFLLSIAKCDPNMKNVNGNTPIQVTSNVNVIFVLFDHGAMVTSDTVFKLLNLGKEFYDMDEYESKLLSVLIYASTSNTWRPDDKNSDGYTALHVACEIDCRDAVEVLLSEIECNPNIKSNDGELPLEMTSDNEIIQLLIEHNASISSHAIVNWMNKVEFEGVKLTFTKLLTFSNWCTTDGDSVLHLMCKLTYQCEDCYEFINHVMKVCGNIVRSTNNDGKVPSQLTCDLTIIEHTLNYGAIIDSDIVFKIMNYRLKPKSSGNDKIEYAEDRIITLLKKSLDQHSCSWMPSDKSSDGNTALHIACETDRFQLTHFLLYEAKCDPNVKNSRGYVPIQLALASRLDITEDLIQHGAITTSDVVLKFISHHLNANLSRSIELLKLAIKDTAWRPGDKTEEGETALHIAVRLYEDNEPSIVHFLLSECRCDPNMTDKDGNTPIQLASNHDAMEDLIQHGATTDTKFIFDTISLQTEKIALRLLQLTIKNTTWKCDDINDDGDTALHVACKIRTPTIVHFLLSEAQCDPNKNNSRRKTPLDLTEDNNMILDLIRHGAKVTAMHKIHHRSLGTNKPLQTPVKIFVVGNPDAGKSTLTAALKTELSFVGRFLRSSRISNVDTKTAGVIPHEFESKYYGRVTLYDFAGHREFHSSHAALLQNAIELSSPIFLLVVNLCDSVEIIEQNIHYWLSFLDNQCGSVSSKPHVIIIGSHADKLKEKGEDPSRKAACIESLNSSKLHIAGFVSMDCQYAQSSGMNELHKLLSTSCSLLRVEEDLFFSAHCFHIYLLDRFRDSTAVTLHFVHTQIQLEQQDVTEDKVLYFLPHSMGALYKICVELNDRGHILFLKDHAEAEKSWVIINKAALLSDVTGTIFAPEDFKQHRSLASNTGVVPLSKLATHFPQHNCDMLVGFLSHLEFCHEICDENLLGLITEQHPLSPDERYYLFPGLIVQAMPENLWNLKAMDDLCYCGWIIQSELFFHARFIQVLLLRMAFRFALAKSSEEVDTLVPAIQRKCSLWKNGIFWGNRFGIEILVEVLSDNKTVIVLTRYSRVHQLNSAKLRSEVISAVFKCVQNCCRSIKIPEYVRESFVDPSVVKQHPIDFKPDLSLFRIQDVAKASIISSQKHPSVVSSTGITLPLQNLLEFEPYSEVDELTIRVLHSGQYLKELFLTHLC